MTWRASLTALACLLASSGPALAQALTGAVTAQETTVTTPYFGGLQQVLVWDFYAARYVLRAWTFDGVTAHTDGAYQVEVTRVGDTLTWESYTPARQGMPRVYVRVAGGGVDLFALWECAPDLCGAVECRP